MRRLMRALYGRLSGSGARSAMVRASIRLHAERRPVLMSGPPEGRRVLVLAPHMDDETFGCGGTLLKHARAGASVAVAFLTDGRRGDPVLNASPLPAPERRAREDRLVARRKDEARRAAEILGVKELIFLDRPDGSLQADVSLVQEVRALLGRLSPDLVYLPFMTDRHPDHFEASRILVEAGGGASGAFRVGGFEIWTPLVANCLVDIGDVVEEKRRAMAQFESQLEHADYLDGILHLNAYRSMVHLRGQGHAEAFFLAPFRDYERLYRDMVGGIRGNRDEDPAHP